MEKSRENKASAPTSLLNHFCRLKPSLVPPPPPPALPTLTQSHSNPLPSLKSKHKPSQTKHSRRCTSTSLCRILSFCVCFSYDLCLYEENDGYYKICLSLVMLEDMSDEVECDQ